MTEFIRFKATDSVELQGWLTDEKSGIAALHIHGMSGNGYENYFLDDLREIYARNKISFFTIDTRGRGIISSFWQGGDADSWGEGTRLGGSCFELFEESAYDIQGALDFLKTRGNTHFILQGHSLGCTKVVNYLNTQRATGIDRVVLLAPTDMARWAATDPHHDEYLARARQLLQENKGSELVGAQCWLDKTPLSAQTYPGICEAGGSADIYSERKGGALLGRITLPMLIAYGDDDIGITKIDGTMDKWVARTDKITHPNTKISVIEGAPHSFKGYEAKLGRIVNDFVKG